MSLMKMCRCGKLIDRAMNGCNQCELKRQGENRERNKLYDSHSRDRQSTKFYNSREWLNTREYILSKHNGIDLYAFFMHNKLEQANTVHHIIELKMNWNRRVDVSNLIPLTESNHNTIHGKYKEDREGTQKMLFNLLKRWDKLYVQRGRGVY